MSDTPDAYAHAVSDCLHAGVVQACLYGRFSWYNARPVLLLRCFEPLAGDDTRLTVVSPQEIKVRAALNIGAHLSTTKSDGM